jgi:hypothetical protein
MKVTQIADGLWCWSIGDRSSAYMEHGDQMILVDPMLPPAGDDLDRFARAIERDLTRLGGSVHVLLTRHGHPRDSDAIEQMTGAVRWHPGMGEAPAGMYSLPVAEGAVALWSPVHRALVVPDAHMAPGGMGMRPDAVIVTGAGAPREDAPPRELA